MSKAATVTTEDLMGVMQDMMQLTSDGFERLEGRMDGLESRMDKIEIRLDRVEMRLDSIEQRIDEIEKLLREHTLQLRDLRELVTDLQNKHAAYVNDITDILDRIQALENRQPEITRAEFEELQQLLQAVVDWAIKVSKQSKTHLNLPSHD